MNAFVNFVIVLICASIMGAVVAWYRNGGEKRLANGFWAGVAILAILGAVATLVMALWKFVVWAWT
jgi:hypothetical protein